MNDTRSRYFAYPDPKTGIVQAWYDMRESIEQPDDLNFHPVSEEDYNQWSNAPGARYENGLLVSYIPPSLPLKEQAQNAMQQVQQQANMVTVMGETFGPDMQAYVKTLRAIIKGTDTTSSTLPIPPEDPTD